MYYRWEFPDERPTEIVEGANQEKMYPDYSYAAQDGGNIKRKVKIGALAITAILIVGAIAAVPAVLLTLPKFKQARNTVAVESKPTQQIPVVSRDSVPIGMNTGMNLLRHDNLTVANRSARQVVDQTVNIENYIERPTQCKNGEYDEEHDTFDKGHADHFEQTPDQTSHTPADNSVQIVNHNSNDTGIVLQSLIINNDSNIDEKFSNALKIIANFQIFKSGLDSKLADVDHAGNSSDAQACATYPNDHQVQQNNTSVNLTELEQPHVIIVFYHVGEGKKRVNAVDFGEQFVQFIKQSETGEWVFDINKLLVAADEAMKPLVNMNFSQYKMSKTQNSEASAAGPSENGIDTTAYEMSDSTPVQGSASTPANISESIPLQISESLPSNMNDTDRNAMTNSQGQADHIVQMLLLNKPFTWILSTKDDQNHYNYFASGPLNVTSVDLVTASLLSGMDSDNLDALVDNLVEKISLVANQGN